eukprot:scaffold103872_cov69-Phaeocystis_antarctica.AAC.1
MMRRLRATADAPHSAPLTSRNADDAWERAGPWAASRQPPTLTLTLTSSSRRLPTMRYSTSRLSRYSS